ncbi:hypothetical protein PU02_0098 [Bartonella ancashensis]|uniref:Uncharacterized protein n=1 Tax=Bartonella ancashensis TaxID=1318743 RepID=A0A0M4M269_9HYPH|nr:hypothetical protein PU02_0098 [Bartonella ancashensis]
MFFRKQISQNFPGEILRQLKKITCFMESRFLIDEVGAFRALQNNKIE